MKVEVLFSKATGNIDVTMTVLNCDGYYTVFVFDGESRRYCEMSFPLTPEGLAKAKKWVSETIACLRAKVEEWRKIELPPKEIIEI